MLLFEGGVLFQDAVLHFLRGLEDFLVLGFGHGAGAKFGEGTGESQDFGVCGFGACRGVVEFFADGGDFCLLASGEVPEIVLAFPLPSAQAAEAEEEEQEDGEGDWPSHCGSAGLTLKPILVTPQRRM